MVKAASAGRRKISPLILILLPALIILGFFLRQEQPDIQPPMQEIGIPPSMVLTYSNNNLWNGLKLTTYIFSGDEGSILMLFPDQAIQSPDALLYWQHGKQNSLLPLADSAMLLGPLNTRFGSRFNLTNHLQEEGAFFLYSMKRQQVLASAELPQDGFEQ